MTHRKKRTGSLSRFVCVSAKFFPFFFLSLTRISLLLPSSFIRFLATPPISLDDVALMLGKAKAKKGGKSCGGNQSDSLGSMDDHEAVADQMPQGTMLKELGMHALYNTYRSHNQMDRRFYTVSIFIIYMTWGYPAKSIWKKELKRIRESLKIQIYILRILWELFICFWHNERRENFNRDKW